jgi:hypothetical protein
VFIIEDKYILAPQSDEVRLICVPQVYFYISKGLQPLRLECGFDNKVVFVFDKEKTLKLFSEWRKLDKNWSR